MGCREILSAFRRIGVSAYRRIRVDGVLDAVGDHGVRVLRRVGNAPVPTWPRQRQAGVSLVELSISLFLLMAIATFGLQTMMSAWLTQNWSIVQSMTDARAGIETAYAQRWTFTDIPASNRWPVYPESSSTTVTIGQTPKGPVIATVVRTRRNFPDLGPDPLTGTQSYLLESYVVYQEYYKVSKVYRTGVLPLP